MKFKYIGSMLIWGSLWGATLSLTGCSAQIANWNVNPTLEDPLENRCVRVLFGEQSCDYEQRRTESKSYSNNEDSDKSLKLEDIPLPYVGVNITTDW